MPTDTNASAKQTDKQNARDRVSELEKRIYEESMELAKLRRELPAEKVNDYTMHCQKGTEVRLSDMFGKHRDLILVHNMGKACTYCTLWADGFTGFVPHLENRAGFVVISKDDIATQKEFYESRDWNFAMYSSDGTTFNRDMGYEKEDGSQHPGISAYHKNDDGTIVRTATTPIGPGDEYCAIWHMFDLLKDGPNGWEPQYKY